MPWRARKSDNFRDSNQEKKQRTDTINKAKKSNDFTRGNREKSNIKIAILKIDWLDGTIIISYFGGTKYIFADCIWLD